MLRQLTVKMARRRALKKPCSALRSVHPPPSMFTWCTGMGVADGTCSRRGGRFAAGVAAAPADVGTDSMAQKWGLTGADELLRVISALSVLFCLSVFQIQDGVRQS